MRNIFIIDTKISKSTVYGIHTYINLLKNILKKIKLNIYIIELQAEVDECRIYSQEYYTVIKFPLLNNEINYSTCVIDILALNIVAIEESVFFFNEFGQYTIATEIKNRYPKSILINIVHYFLWMRLVYGKEDIFMQSIKVLGIDTQKSQLLYNHYISHRQSLEVFNRIISLSDDSFSLLRFFYMIPANKLLKITNGLDDKFREISEVERNKIKSDLFLAPGEKILLYVGRLDNMKGIDTLISAFNGLMKIRRDCRLVIVGDGNFSAISSLLKEGAARITFTGRIPQKEVYKWYRIADIGILPSLSEECSFVGIEMLMHGLPVIATNGRGVRNMFHHMENSLTVNCRGSKTVFKRELREAILKLLDSPELCSSLRTKARQWYLDHYHIKYMREGYISLINKIIAESSWNLPENRES